MTINSKSNRPDLEYFSSFSSAFRKKAHQLISWGYRGALARIKDNSHEETTITGYISETIINKLRAFNCPTWCEDFSVMENRPVEKDGREGKTRPQPDLIIEGTMRGRPEYIFESKRLKRNDFGIGKYLGQDGLGCFLSGKYASRYNEAAMLGYIQNDSPNGWKADIQKKINQDNIRLQLLSLPQDVDIISDFPGEWETTHYREVTGRAISIFHILLDFRSSV